MRFWLSHSCQLMFLPRHATRQPPCPPHTFYHLRLTGQPYATIGLAQGVTAAEASGADADAQRREFELRLSVFTSNLKVAEELSAKDLGTASYGASPFAAMTVEEFTSTRLQARPARLKGDDLAKSCLANGAISPPPPTVVRSWAHHQRWRPAPPRPRPAATRPCFRRSRPTRSPNPTPTSCACRLPAPPLPHSTGARRAL